MIKSMITKQLQLNNLYSCDFNREIMPAAKLADGLISNAIKLEQESVYHKNINI